MEHGWGTQARFRASIKALIWTSVSLSLLIFGATQLGCAKKGEAKSQGPDVIFRSTTGQGEVYRLNDGLGALYIAVDHNGTVTAMATRKY